MPLDVLGRTRATLTDSASYVPLQKGNAPWPEGLGNLAKLRRDGDRSLQLWILNEEFLVSAGHQPALITSLPFVHTARRSYRLNDPVRTRDCFCFRWRKPSSGSKNMPESYHLEEGEVVTRFP